jgi:hypothetical protein
MDDESRGIKRKAEQQQQGMHVQVVAQAPAALQVQVVAQAPAAPAVSQLPYATPENLVLYPPVMLYKRLLVYQWMPAMEVRHGEYVGRVAILIGEDDEEEDEEYGTKKMCVLQAHPGMQQTNQTVKIGLRAMVPLAFRWTEASAFLSTINDEIKTAMFLLYSHMLRADIMYDGNGDPWPRNYLSLQALKLDPESKCVDESQWVYSDELFNDLMDQQLVKKVAFGDEKARQARDAALSTAACISEYSFVNLQANCQCSAMEKIVKAKDKAALVDLLSSDHNCGKICYSHHGPKDGFCLLHMSVAGKWLEGTQILLMNQGQDINARCGRNAGTALHLAAMAGDDAECQAITTMLVQAGAEKNACDMDTTEYTSGDWLTR